MHNVHKFLTCVLMFGVMLSIFGLMSEANHCDQHLIETFINVGHFVIYVAAAGTVLTGLRPVVNRIAKAEARKSNPDTRLLNVHNVVKMMLEDTNALIGEPELQEDDTWNVEVSEYHYQLLMREHLGTDRSKA